MKSIATTLAFLFFNLLSTGQTSISGTVRDANQEPLPSVSVQLLDGKTCSPVETTATDGYGQFTFERVKEGNYLVRASFDGRSVVISPKPLADGKTADLCFSKFRARAVTVAAQAATKTCLAEPAPAGK